MSSGHFLDYCFLFKAITNTSPKFPPFPSEFLIESQFSLHPPWHKVAIKQCQIPSECLVFRHKRVPRCQVVFKSVDLWDLESKFPALKLTKQCAQRQAFSIFNLGLLTCKTGIITKSQESSLGGLNYVWKAFT